MAKDTLQAVRQVRSRPDTGGWSEQTPVFVWQHHELFHRAGERAARMQEAPLIEYVHAPVVWEARRWGVERRGWGGLLERVGERPSLLAADLVACVSEEVAAEVLRFGVAEERVLVSPMAVDPERFAPPAGGSTRSDHDDFRIGWVGSFRKFHALGLLLRAVSALREQGCPAVAVLVGDGFERTNLERQAADLAIESSVEFRGQVANPELPVELANIDCAVITADAGQEFHYSPLKLREYMAMALPVVAPRLGDIARMINDGVDGILYEPGDVGGLARSLSELASDRDRRFELGSRARERVLEVGTWDVVLADALDHLKLS